MAAEAESKAVNVKTSTSRNYCLTFFQIFNIHEYKLDESIQYIIFGREIAPTTEREHIHAYVEFKQSVRWRHIKTIFNDDTVHIEKRAKYSTAEDAIAYVQKHGDFCEYGKHLGQGHRTDLDDVAEKLKKNISLSTIVDENLTSYIKFGKGIKDAKAMIDKKLRNKLRDVSVEVYWGVTGSGKTWRAYSENPELYRLGFANHIWFDNYDGEATLLIDEIDKMPNLQFGELLHLTDKFPVRLETKGSFTYANWTKVILTANKPIHQWFSNVFTPDDLAPLIRRITKVIHFTEKWHP